jgi:hypothetical protein
MSTDAVYDIRRNCSQLFNTPIQEICNLFFVLLLQDEDGIWNLYSRLIHKKLEKKPEDVEGWVVIKEILDQICESRVYLEMVFREKPTGKWELFIWPFGITTKQDLKRNIKRPNIKIEANCETNIYIMQCAQIIILSDIFTIRRRDIYGFHMIYSAMEREMNIHANTLFDKNKIIGVILSRISKIYLKFFPLVNIFNKEEKPTIKEDVKKCIEDLKIPFDDSESILQSIESVINSNE